MKTLLIFLALAPASLHADSSWSDSSWSGNTNPIFLREYVAGPTGALSGKIIVGGKECKVRTICPDLNPKPKPKPKPVSLPPPCIQPEYIFREAQPLPPAPELTTLNVDAPTVPTADVPVDNAYVAPVLIGFLDGGPSVTQSYPSSGGWLVRAPEIDPTGAATAITLLVGGLVVFLSRRK